MATAVASAAAGTTLPPPPASSPQGCCPNGRSSGRWQVPPILLLALFGVVAAFTTATEAVAQHNVGLGPLPLSRRSTGAGVPLSGRLNPSISLQPPQLLNRRQSAASGPDAPLLVAGVLAGEEPAGIRPPRPDATAPPQRPPAPARPSVNRGGQRPPGDFVFPESPPPPPPTLVFPQASNACAHREGSTFCEEVDNYPGRQIFHALENTVGFGEFFGNDSISNFVRPRVSDRLAGETTLCTSEEKLIFPKLGQNEKDQWLYIVNLDGDYRQGIRVETCKSVNSSCLLAKNFPPGSNPTCRQKYVYRKLLAISNEGEPQTDSFRMPSCCVCFVENSVMSEPLRSRSDGRSRERRSHSENVKTRD